MAAQPRNSTDPRFNERDDDTIKVFDALPPRSVVEDLRHFTKRTGQPDLWPWHLHTKPRLGSRFLIVADGIAVPESLRSRVGLAPCPQCSLHAGKFFEGMLVWFPEERALRVIGNECAKHVAGERALTDARADFKVRKEDDRALAFLIENWAIVHRALPAILELHRRSRQLDKVAKAIRGSLREEVRKPFLDAEIAPGSLGLYQWTSVPQIDRRGMAVLGKDGEVRYVEGRDLVAVKQVQGLAVFGARQLCESYTFRAASALDGLVVDDEDGALELLSKLDRAGRIEAERRIRDAWGLLDKAISLFQRVQRFLEPGNIEALAEWGQDSRASIRLYAAARASGRVEIGEFGRKAVTIFPHADLDDVLPAIPALRDPR